MAKGRVLAIEFRVLFDVLQLECQVDIRHVPPETQGKG